METRTTAFHVNTPAGVFDGTIRVLPLLAGGLHVTQRDWHQAFSKLRGPVHSLTINDQKFNVRKRQTGDYGVYLEPTSGN